MAVTDTVICVYTESRGPRHVVPTSRAGRMARVFSRLEQAAARPYAYLIPMDQAVASGPGPSAGPIGIGHRASRPIGTAVLDLLSGSRERSRLPTSARYRSFRALPGIVSRTMSCSSAATEKNSKVKS